MLTLIVIGTVIGVMFAAQSCGEEISELDMRQTYTAGGVSVTPTSLRCVEYGGDIYVFVYVEAKGRVYTDDFDLDGQAPSDGCDAAADRAGVSPLADGTIEDGGAWIAFRTEVGTGESRLGYGSASYRLGVLTPE